MKKDLFDEEEFMTEETEEETWSEEEVMKKYAKLSPKQREYFERLTAAYLNGEFTSEQLHACEEGSETFEEWKHLYSGSKAE